jgi:replication-associated recombination protein RarA
MIPNTLNGLSPFDCMSAMQKAIRRGLEREAMEFASELAWSRKQCFAMVCNRLLIISHEDIGLANPDVPPFVLAAVRAAEQVYRAEDLGAALLILGNAIRMMARSPKSREADHFVIAVGVRPPEGFAPDIPDWAHDKHTQKGRQMGRGVDHFITEGAKLDNDITPNDPYREEAHKRLRARNGRTPKLGDRPKSNGTKSLFGADGYPD